MRGVAHGDVNLSGSVDKDMAGRAREGSRCELAPSIEIEEAEPSFVLIGEEADDSSPKPGERERRR
ncbi:MAG: hypothetical protein HUU21_19215 [Polyangiaceae bacterium]|nr:hypothetical protein [Polyangiaceae bacterium]